MAIGYHRDDVFVVFVAFGELTQRLHPNSKRSYWALSAVGALSTLEENHGQVDRYEFDLVLLPAIEKIFEKKRAILQFLSVDDCELRLVQFLTGTRPNLHDVVEESSDSDSSSSSTS